MYLYDLVYVKDCVWEGNFTFLKIIFETLYMAYNIVVHFIHASVILVPKYLNFLR